MSAIAPATTPAPSSLRQLLDAITPLPGRLIVGEPRALRSPKRTATGLYLSEHSERTRRTAGLVAIVLKCAADVERCFAVEGVRRGVYVYVPEFAGTPLYTTDGSATGLWVIGAGDIIAVIDDIDAVGFAG